MESVITPRRRQSLCAFFLCLVMAAVAPRASAEFISALSRCPIPCSFPGSDPAAWTYYHDLQVLESCEQTVLFEMNLYNALNDTQTHIGFRACTTQGAVLQAPDFIQVRPRDDGEEGTGNLQKRAAVNALSWGPISSNINETSISSALTELTNFVKNNPAHTPALFSRREDAVAGVYIGPGIDVGSATAVMEAFVTATGAQKTRRAVQWCGVVNGTADRQSFGIIVDTQGDVSAVQSALAQWANGKCLRGDQSDGSWWPHASPTISTTLASSESSSNNTNNTVAPSTRKRKTLSGRATCSYIQAQSGDGCYSLAQRCRITQPVLQSYNGGASFCNSIQLNQYVCCSSGTLPDFSPKPTNGYCYAYTVQANDLCSSIATAHQMQVSGIVNNNNQTWGWMGCSDLQIGQRICLSTGIPPFPINVPNAVCGPQVNNTAQTSAPSTWSNLNPCPLNACCDIWGQCGITSEFCTAAPADTGAPGTAQPGSNGCISNCGTQIVTSAAPDSFVRIGYFEAWNTQRSCLHMWPQSIPAYYTHVHFAFANISADFNVDISAAQDMFNQFKAATGFKHILSFGGWAFSTSPQTYPIFREGVTPAQRQTFATNVANFIMANGMDGVDFDWEYPGAPDIPGIPPGSPQDGPSYLKFLQLVRAALPPQYSISIAAPASYWYLKGFPIAAISNVVDYIIYMTYDLHGQWDYGNSFSDPGCPKGGCLRSHVNRTETEQAFSMITKAGVPSNKIMVGMALYGRSFQMSQAGCYTEMCTFTGPNSGATPGKCTDTAGYISNWEIQEILDTPGNNAQRYFSSVAGDIVVYNGNQYISYMTTQTYNSRLDWARSLNFGGTSDWAMDLETSYYGNGTEVGTGSGVVYVDPSVLTQSAATIACQPPCTFVLPPWILSTSTVISQPPITETVLDMYHTVQTLSNGVTSTVYISVTTVTTITLPPVMTQTISVWNVEWTDVSQTIIYFTSSVVFPPVYPTEASNVIQTTQKTTTLAGIIYTFRPGPYTGPPTSTPTPNPPPPGLAGSVHVTVGPPKPTCLPGGLGCGSLCLSNCFPELPCIGICGCIGLGCPGGGSCVGPGCGSGGDDGSSSSRTSCGTTYTVTDCQVDCSITDFGTSTTTTCYSTTCVTVEACSKTGSTSTSKTTSFACPWTTALIGAMWTPTDPNALPPVLGGGGAFGYTYVTGSNAPTLGSQKPTTLAACNYFGQDPDNGVAAQYCVCSGSTFPATMNTAYPGNSCAYSSLPSKTTSISTLKQITTLNCQVCTFEGENAQCSMIKGCTPTTAITITTAATPTTTGTVVVTPKADCAFWDEGWGWRFEVYNIANWATDGGRSLHDQEDGCGALTGWDWKGPTPSSYPLVHFNLPFFIANGCVERAIASAGGPKLSCQGQGLDIKKRLLGGIVAEDEEADAEAQRRKRAITAENASRLPVTSTPTYTYNSSIASIPTYIPMKWTGTDTVPVTSRSTFTTTTTDVFTTVIHTTPSPTRYLAFPISTG